MLIYILIAIGIFVVVSGAYILTQMWIGKNQIITDQAEQITELKEIRDVYVKELREEQLRNRAITELYDEVSSKHEQLRNDTGLNIFKNYQHDVKFFSLDAQPEPEEKAIAV